MNQIEKLDLKEHIASQEKKQRYVTRLFERIARRYDFFTSFMSFGMDRGWKRQLVRVIDWRGTEQILDIACGTGDITFMAAARLARGCAVGLDITGAMVEIAEQKRRAAGATNVCFHRGDIMHLPF